MRSAQTVEAGRAEPRLSHLGESKRVEPRLTAAPAVRHCDGTLDLVRALRAFRQVERAVVGRDGERSTTHQAEERVDLPSAQDVRGEALVDPVPPLAEGQFPYRRELEVVCAIEVTERAIQ